MSNETEKTVAQAEAFMESGYPHTHQIHMGAEEDIKAVGDSLPHWVTNRLDLLNSMVCSYQILLISAAQNSKDQKIIDMINNGFQIVEDHVKEYDTVLGQQQVRKITLNPEFAEQVISGKKTLLRSSVKNPEWLGCLTGDCPHQKQTECDADIKAYAQKYYPYGRPGDILEIRGHFTRIRITDISISRLQDITKEQALKLGLTDPLDLLTDIREMYRLGFVLRHGQSFWDRNPWLFNIDFELLPRKALTSV